MSLDLDMTYVVVLVLFLLPLVILNGIVIRPFLKLFEERHEQLEGALERAEDLLEQAERRAATFEQRIRVAAEDGRERRAQLRTEAMSQMHERIGEERTKMDEKLAKALKEVQADRDRALAEVQAEAEALAELTAQKLLGRPA